MIVNIWMSQMSISILDKKKRKHLEKRKKQQNKEY